MENSIDLSKTLFKQLFSKDNSFEFKIEYARIDKILFDIANLLGNTNYIHSKNIVLYFISQIKNKEKKSKAQFCIIWHCILDFCSKNEINHNLSLCILLAIYISEYSKEYKINLADVEENITKFNKDDGPLLSPENWTNIDCDKILIGYYLRELYLTAIETTKNHFAILSDNNYNYEVLKRKNTLFMSLLLEKN